MTSSTAACPPISDTVPTQSVSPQIGLPWDLLVGALQGGWAGDDGGGAAEWFPPESPYRRHVTAPNGCWGSP
jgi:hypothetical protein